MKKSIIALILTLLMLFVIGCKKPIDDVNVDITPPNNTVYTITLDLGEVKTNTKASISVNELKVKNGEDFILPTPTCEYYEFLYWVIEGTLDKVTSGKYALDKDVTLVAVWKSLWSDAG